MTITEMTELSRQREHPLRRQTNGGAQSRSDIDRGNTTDDFIVAIGIVIIVISEEADTILQVAAQRPRADTQEVHLYASEDAYCMTNL